MDIRNFTIGLAIAAIALTPTTALAKGGDDGETRVAGNCTGRSAAKLKVKPDDGRLEAEFEVDQNRNGVTWSVRLRRDGRLAVSGRATTKAPSGSFSFERRIASGSRITAIATSPSGETCRASASVR
jgi:hypothetical protein